ncbi:helix-turn-helix domain-containing protein [Micromonospora sp. DT4]|uniref:helix-turn-helix domain-containing protein n=1 Tax=Micromonospora sp. DT4 TaxID=3393438 RepID=UPI003CF3329C
MGTVTDYVLEELRLLRAEAGLSQDDFGRGIGYSGSHVSSVETGGRPPTKEYMRAVDNHHRTGERFQRMLERLGRLDAEDVDRIVASRLERQAILRRPSPPQLIAVLDEAVLRRPVLDQPGLMLEQCEHLVELAAQEHIQVHVVPVDAGMYLGLAGQFIIAEMPDGERVAHADNQLTAQIVATSTDVAKSDRQ